MRAIRISTFSYRPRVDGQARLSLARAATDGGRPAGRSRRLAPHADLPEADRAAIEAEPNDSWQQANDLRLGRDVYGSGDDVDYLENRAEGKSGLDWFRFEVKQDKPILVYFQLDLLDRDVSANLRVYTVDPKTNTPVAVPDRQRSRWRSFTTASASATPSTSAAYSPAGPTISRSTPTIPDYILRTRVLPVPPYDEASQAVEAGMHYIMNVGDAWFAQVPREGNIYVRSANMHDTATRCTACHPFELFDRGQPDRSSQWL